MGDTGQNKKKPAASFAQTLGRIFVERPKRLLERYVFGDSADLSPDVRILNIFCIVAFAFSIFEAATLPALNYGGSLIMIVASFLFAALIVYGNRRKNYRLVLCLALFITGDIFNPLLFYLNGGLTSVMSVYFVMLILTAFLLCQGRMLYVMLAIQFTVVVFTYRYGYLHYGEMFQQTPLMQYHDNIKSIFSVGLFSGMTIFAQAKMYRDAKQKSDEMVLRLQETDQRRLEALENAISASRAKTDFLSNMSHEMRTPLNAIIGMTSLGLSSKDPERKDYCMQKVETASQHLLGIINDILDMSQIEANKLELYLERFDFQTMLQRAVNNVTFQADEKRQSLRVDIDGALDRAFIGDEKRLAQVFTNLLSNAVKFTPEEGSIALRVTAEGAGAVNALQGMVKIRADVTDTGIGIAPEAQTRLFQSFEQVERGMSRKYGGTGLGLAISKRIVELMGGEIWVKSAPGEGSTFSFRVSLATPQPDRPNQPQAQTQPQPTQAQPMPTPMQAQPVQPSPQPAQPPQAQPQTAGADNYSGRAILVADDVDINQEIIGIALKPTGAKLVFAENGERALQKYLEAGGAFDLILMDVQMPVMDGFDAALRIRRSGLPGAERVPVVIMTSQADSDDDAERRAAAGIELALQKPIDLPALLQTVRSALP